MAIAIVDDLAVPLIVSTAYQDKFIESILRKARRLKPVNSRLIAILDSFVSDVRTLKAAEDAQPIKVYLCSHSIIHLMSEGSLKVCTFASGL